MIERIRTRNGGVELVADVHEPSTSRTVVFLPTAGESRAVWAPVTQAVGARGWRTVAPDYRGHGESGRAATYALEDFCDDTLEVVARLSDTPRVLVGGSIGGVIAMLLIGEGKVDAAGLVLVDIVAAPRHEAGQRERRKIAAALARDDPATASLDPRVREGGLAAEVIRQRERITRAARAIDLPTLLLHGARSHVIGARELTDFAADFRRGEAMEVHGAGHLVARDQPAPVAEALTGFLQRLIPG